MPFCPNCRTEYRSGFEQCTDCGALLVASLPEEEAESVDIAHVELAELAGFPNSSEAAMIQELLEENGIGTVLRGDLIGTVTILVKEDDLPTAQKLYEDYFAAEVEVEPEPDSEDPQGNPGQQ